VSHSSRHIIRFIIGVAVFYATLYASTAQAGEGRQRLDNFFNSVSSMRADFKQEVRDERLTVIQESSGMMLVQRPNRFRWDYTTPYKQLIISNGRDIWLYDLDLEQITVQSVDTALGRSPALLLSGKEPLEKNFSIKELGPVKGIEWLELVPFRKDGSFERMRLAFNGMSELIEMEFVDRLGQVTRIEFTGLQSNPVIEAEMFEFTPPAGVDVLRQEE
jgi:outer membrane lipoprotein carrier protein